MSECCRGPDLKPSRFFLIAAVIVFADQITKWSVLRSLALGESRPAIGSVMILTYTRNTGGAFSLLQGGNYFFVAVALFAIGALIYAFMKFQRKDTAIATALSLALGGAIGNLIDRLRFKFVIDFFDFHGWTNHNIWPIFNVADSAISIGIVLLAWNFLFTKEPKPANESATQANSNEPVSS